MQATPTAPLTPPTHIEQRRHCVRCIHRNNGVTPVGVSNGAHMSTAQPPFPPENVRVGAKTLVSRPDVHCVTGALVLCRSLGSVSPVRGCGREEAR